MLETNINIYIYIPTLIHSISLHTTLLKFILCCIFYNLKDFDFSIIQLHLPSPLLLLLLLASSFHFVSKTTPLHETLWYMCYKV